ncbi:MAG: hypothetical protein N4A57_15995 [Anaeromicrobium sp.]|nr:hypothetical protein [Anaeromicrobium sp.]MCT4595750.1 hypothetical protein [Anaeromicrobium sp.]
MNRSNILKEVTREEAAKIVAELNETSKELEELSQFVVKLHDEIVKSK